MRPIATSRALLRQSRSRVPRNNIRQASKTSEALAKGKETAKEAGSAVQSEASEQASTAAKFVKSAGGVVESAQSRAQDAASKIGGRSGRMIAFVGNLIPPAVYSARVGFEVCKVMFQSQKLYPPSYSHLQYYFQSTLNAVKSPKSLVSKAGSTISNISPATVLSTVRNTNGQQLVSLGVLGAEVLGFFTVGTMIGRLKIVGYRGDVSHEH